MYVYMYVCLYCMYVCLYVCTVCIYLQLVHSNLNLAPKSRSEHVITRRAPSACSAIKLKEKSLVFKFLLVTLFISPSTAYYLACPLSL